MIRSTTEAPHAPPNYSVYDLTTTPIRCKTAPMTQELEEHFPNIFAQQWISPSGHLANDFSASDPGGLLPESIGRGILELLEKPDLAMISVRTNSGRVFEMSRSEPGQTFITTREIKCPQLDNS